MNDEKLILYYYNDGLSVGEREEIRGAIERDDALEARYATLSRALDALGDAPDVAVPEGLEYRLQSTVARAARLQEDSRLRPARAFRSSFLAWGTALAAALALGIGIGAWMAGDPVSDPPGLVQVPADDTPEWSVTAFQRGLETHFRTSRSELSELPRNGETDRATLVASLMEQNRLYARLALQNDAPELARVLRSFEPLLLQLGKEDVSEGEAARLRDQLEFEFAVMLTKLSRAASQQTEPNKQEVSL